MSRLIHFEGALYAGARALVAWLQWQRSLLRQYWPVLTHSTFNFDDECERYYFLLKLDDEDDPTLYSTWYDPILHYAGKADTAFPMSSHQIHWETRHVRVKDVPTFYASNSIPIHMTHVQSQSQRKQSCLFSADKDTNDEEEEEEEHIIYTKTDKTIGRSLSAGLTLTPSSQPPLFTVYRRNNEYFTVKYTHNELVQLKDASGDIRFSIVFVWLLLQ